jgi:6-pyruvoyltetrahydropterin/6-carboxytetrahydropterin synthase
MAKVRAALPAESVAFPGAEVGALRGMISNYVAPLDYDAINTHVSIPTDENIARWIRSKFTLSGVDTVGIQSTRDEGIDLDRDDRAHIWRRYAFQAAHRLPNVPPGHKCGRMHGHGFEVIIHVKQELSHKEMGIDYDHLDAIWAPIHEELNNRCLNDIAGLENPTSELIASWLWARLKDRLPHLAWVTVYETATCGANYDGKRHRIWKEMFLDSAIRLTRAPRGGGRGIHGHTYVLRLHLDAPLDEVMGWTIDFGDVKDLFSPVFAQLDHQPLYELSGIEDNDVASLLHWIRRSSMQQIPSLTRIDLYETRGCGAILSWSQEPPALPI